VAIGPGLRTFTRIFLPFSSLSHVEQRQRFLNRKQRSARVQAEGRVEVLLGNLAQWDCFAPASAGKEDVNLALLPPDRIEQAVEVVEIGRVAAHAGHVPANHLDGLVQCLLPPTRDENVGTMLSVSPFSCAPRAVTWLDS
jgi:hypothetical protein